MQHVLVISFSQSGQLKDIVTHISKGLAPSAAVDFFEIQPETPFPFPWPAHAFFDAMPECVLELPPAIRPMPELLVKDYDLVILGVQPWFLWPSQPVTAFLQSPWAKALNNKPVVTVIGCRNMWLKAIEVVKGKLKLLNARHVGHIVLEDHHKNLTSLRTVIRWLTKGEKGPGGGLPEAGVSQADIRGASRFGELIRQHMEDGSLERLQAALLAAGAVNLHPNLILLEKRGVSQYPKWAQRARAKGGPGSEARKPVIRKFQRILLAAIFVLSPITGVAAKLQAALRRKTLEKEVTYFKSTAYHAGKL